MLLLALVTGPLLAEGCLRWILFSPSDVAERFRARFWEPSLYCSVSNSDDSTKLFWLFGLGRRRQYGVPPFADAEIGWLKAEIEPVTYAHAAESALRGRRPVLLYGSSFAACAGQEDGCFSELLDASELGRSHGLLDYAVSGHGVDQSLLLLEKSLDRYAGRDPVVVLAFVLESDMDRATLSFFTRPKPRFRLQDGAAVLELPDELDVLAYLDRHPPSIRSYFWRYLVNGTGVPLETRRRWEGEEARRAELEALSAFLLREFERACAERGLEHFVLLFHTKQILSSAPQPGERAAHALMDELHVPWVDSRADVERALVSRRCTLDDLFGEGSHPSGLGTAVLFEALARGLGCRLDGGQSR